MNGDNQPQQEQHQLTERVARVENAIEFHSKAFSELREEMRLGFARVDAQFERFRAEVRDDFIRVHEEIRKSRTTDFRILLSIGITTALGTFGLIIKALGLF